MNQTGSQPKLPIIGQRYQLYKELGKGGMGSVFLAFDSRLKRKVAIKTTHQQDEQTSQNFLHEAQVLASLNHPNVVAIFHFGQENNVDYMVMEYIEGMDLTGYFYRKVYSISDFLKIFKSCCIGIQTLHAANIIHRDIKADNFIIDATGTVKAVDMGLSAFSKELTEADRFVRGTVGYLPPEAFADPNQTVQGDIFALGVIFAKAILCANPYAAATVEESLAKMKIPLPFHGIDLAIIPPEVISIINRMVHLDKTQRYQTATAVLQDLETIQLSEVLQTLSFEGLNKYNISVGEDAVGFLNETPLPIYSKKCLIGFSANRLLQSNRVAEDGKTIHIDKRSISHDYAEFQKLYPRGTFDNLRAIKQKGDQVNSQGGGDLVFNDISQYYNDGQYSLSMQKEATAKIQSVNVDKVEERVPRTSRVNRQLIDDTYRNTLQNNALIEGIKKEHDEKIEQEQRTAVREVVLFVLIIIAFCGFQYQQLRTTGLLWPEQLQKYSQPVKDFLTRFGEHDFASVQTDDKKKRKISPGWTRDF